MALASNIMVGIVAALHLYFLVLEMFLWTTPRGQRTFGLTPEFAQQSRSLAMNQGLYNGFLAAGLIWGITLGAEGFEVKVFFLICVIIAGVFGGITTGKRTILLFQALPALIALILVWFAR